MPKVRAGLLVGLLIFVGAGLQAASALAPPQAVPGPALDAAHVSRPSLPTPRLPDLQAVEWSPRTTDHGSAPTQIRIRFNRPVVAMGDPGMLAAKDVLTAVGGWQHRVAGARSVGLHI